MSRRRITAVFAISFCLFAASDPFSGVWKLNVAKSKLPSPVTQSQTVYIDADANGIKVREEIVNDKGEHITVTAYAKFDGKDYPISGSSFSDTVAYQRVDSRTLKGAVKKAGALIMNETAVVSRDGKRVTSTYTDPTGKTAGVAVFDKQ